MGIWSLHKIFIIIVSSVFILLAGLFFALQNEVIYKKSLGLVANTWTWENNARVLLNVPYDSLNNENYIQWDAKQYKYIKEYGYDTKNNTVTDHVFAFFPLFPITWRLSQLPAVGLIFLNYLFFSTGLYFLFLAFNNKNIKILLICFTLPGLVLFIMPYTEALFFFFVSLAVYGYINKKYSLFFLCLVLAAMTRPAALLFLITVGSVEFIAFLKTRSFTKSVKNFILIAAPLVVGTFLASFYQNIKNENFNILKFIEVQALWDNKFSIPTEISDWSHESYGINISVLIMFILPLIFYFLFELKKAIRIKDPFTQINYLKFFTIIFLLLSFSFTFFFKNGSLNGLFRYTLCTPFYFILIFIYIEELKKAAPHVKILILVTLFIITGILLTVTPYSPVWNFSDLGYFIFASMLGLTFFIEKQHTKIYNIFLFLLLAINIVWTTYLFDMYISNSWLFT